MSDGPPPGWKFESDAGTFIRDGILKHPRGEIILKSQVRLDDLIDFVGGVIDKHKELEERVEILEARPTLKYAGVWKEDAVYGEGALVTHSGCLWYAKRASVGDRPGETGGLTWTLTVKKGRDGKDLR